MANTFPRRKTVAKEIAASKIGEIDLHKLIRINCSEIRGYNLGPAKTYTLRGTPPRSYAIKTWAVTDN